MKHLQVTEKELNSLMVALDKYMSILNTQIEALEVASPDAHEILIDEFNALDALGEKLVTAKKLDETSR